MPPCIRTEDYLNNIVNREENISDLLDVFIQTTESESGAVFINEGNMNYNCICYRSDVDMSIDLLTFTPSTLVNQITISNSTSEICGLCGQSPLSRCMIIPIGLGNTGVLCLMNKKDEYQENSIVELTPFIGIIQLVMGKYKCSIDYSNRSNSQEVGQDLFLANMSHEIRTPLNGVIGYNQLMSQTDLNTTQKEYLSSMNDCSIQLMKIINDVLDFSKLSSGKMDINEECVSISEIISVVYSTMKQRIKEKKQEIEIIVNTENIPDLIVLDKQKIIQVLVNLLSNAHKFTGVRGKLKIMIKNIGDNLIQMLVEDNGIGMSYTDQEKIFNVFEQLSPSKNGGTGLGLVISKKLVTLLGGTIKVTSEENIGTTFVVTLPFKRYEELEKIVDKESKSLKGHSVLVVDDNADNRIVLTEMLFDWGMKPIACASALEALTLILGDRHKFSFALIDICMPTITGVELAQQIKKERPFFPLIALSSLDTYIPNTNFEQKLDKPINKIRLFDTIQNVLKKSKHPNCYIGSNDNTPNSDSSTTSDNFNKNAKILIAEDIIYNRNLLVSMLENCGYSKISTAENGKIALDMLVEAYDKGKPYDVILLDLIMPEMNGYDIMKVIQSKNWARPEIVVVTASILEKDKQECKKHGIKYFIEKPIQLNQLREVMLHTTELS